MERRRRLVGGQTLSQDHDDSGNEFGDCSFLYGFKFMDHASRFPPSQDFELSATYNLDFESRARISNVMPAGVIVPTHLFPRIFYASLGLFRRYSPRQLSSC
jgi:hypothetical protein